MNDFENIFKSIKRWKMMQIVVTLGALIIGMIFMYFIVDYSIGVAAITFVLSFVAAWIVWEIFEDKITKECFKINEIRTNGYYEG